ncbi:hypothetical protein DPMN_094914 [Dreissena polymorpha]|uniref:Uncharacterized protein n=1 Tax=Dreissena polymorpha TaxID=45954 RepID=A0A9D4R3A3_DREPO|nr:hypothetical protein DPMN_094914 [Dreissena polymorpha]
MILSTSSSPSLSVCRQSLIRDSRVASPSLFLCGVHSRFSKLNSLSTEDVDEGIR